MSSCYSGLTSQWSLLPEATSELPNESSTRPIIHLLLPVEWSSNNGILGRLRTPHLLPPMSSVAAIHRFSVLLIYYYSFWNENLQPRQRLPAL